MPLKQVKGFDGTPVKNVGGLFVPVHDTAVSRGARLANRQYRLASTKAKSASKASTQMKIRAGSPKDNSSNNSCGDSVSDDSSSGSSSSRVVLSGSDRDDDDNYRAGLDEASETDSTPPSPIAAALAADDFVLDRRHLLNNPVPNQRGANPWAPLPPALPSPYLNGWKADLLIKLFWRHLLWHAQHGLYWPYRQPQVFVGAVLVTLVLLCRELCSAGPVCQFYSPLYLLFLDAVSKPVKFLARCILHMLYILGIWNAFEGTARWVRNVGTRMASNSINLTGNFLAYPPRNIRKTMSDTMQDALELLGEPLLLIICEVSFAGFMPEGPISVRVLFASFMVHVVKWCSQAIDLTLVAIQQRQPGYRTVKQICLCVMMLVLLIQQRHIFSAQPYRDAARAYYQTEGYSRDGGVKVINVDDLFGSGIESVIESVFTVKKRIVKVAANQTMPPSITS